MDSSPKFGTAELLYKCAQQMNLNPVWIIPKGLFTVSVDGQEKYVNHAHSSLNSHVAASLAKNKYKTRLILQRHGLANIPFAQPKTVIEAAEFLNRHEKIIAKPINGSGSRGVHIVTSPAQLQELDITKYILEKYILGKEMRYLTLNGSVIAVHQSEYGTSVEATRPLQRISYPEPDWHPSLVASSIQVADALGLNFAAVDYMIDESGHAYILEVNSTPGLRLFHAPSSGPVVNVAQLFLEAMLKDRVLSPDTSVSDEKPLAAYPVLAYN